MDETSQGISFNRIARLVTQEGFYFQAWDDRYSKGVWAALGLWDQVDIVRDLSNAGDLDMIPAMDYIFSADWLPYVTGQTMKEAMQKLEERLTLLPQDQISRNGQWTNLVSKAVEALSDATRGRSWYDGNNMPESLDNLPATFELAVKQVEETGRNKSATNAG
ncbi:hypothetical protein HAP94_06405 [Acidithiobacillus ferrivorans]|nr:hypothetical protein [Acidithiobacillus ferrivorans]